MAATLLRRCLAALLALSLACVAPVHAAGPGAIVALSASRGPDTILPNARHVTTGGFVNTGSVTRVATGLARDTHAFYDRYRVSAKSGVTYLQPVFSNCRINNATNAGSELCNPQAVTFDRLSLQYGTSSVAITCGGSRTCVLRPGQELLAVDRVPASAFGLTQIPASATVYVKGTYKLATNAAAYTRGQTMRPAAEQVFIASSGNYDAIGQVDTLGPFTAPASYNDGTTTWSVQSLPVATPILMLGEYVDKSARSLAIFSDSKGFRLGDTGGDGESGGGPYKRAAWTAGLANATIAIGGYDAYFYGNNSTFQKTLWRYFDILHIAQGTNGVSNGRTLAQLLADYDRVRGDFRRAPRGYGRTTIIQSTISTRISAGNTWNGNTTNRATTLAGQTLYNTQATDAQGVRTGLGYESGGTRDQLNAWIKANVGVGNGPDIAFDVASYVDDPSDRTKFKLGTFSTTLKSAATAGASSFVLTDAPTVGMCLVIEPDGATTAVDPRGAYTQSEVNSGTAANTTAFNVVSFTGNATSGYTVSLYPLSDPIANGVSAVPPALNFSHPVNAVAKETTAQDETHECGRPLLQMATDLAPTYAAQ
ncbi:UNVERIFIED_CONTAM: hypothetical protein Q9R58_22155 [Methylobacteriaceae bacterium AG10]|nr:hypothetical protein [Methylobacteriaceae bacterium AG10]